MPLVQTRGAASAQGFGEFAQASGPVTYIEEVFSTYLYTGNNSTQTITNNIDLSTKGGLVWLKSRSAAYSHRFVDTVRGATKELYSNATSAQGTDAAGLTAFTTTGFTLGSSYSDTETWATWTFRKQPKFFDVVTYTGSGSGTQTIPHSLGSVPGMIITKLVSGGDTSGVGGWGVYHRSTGASQVLELNLTVAAATDNWYTTTPTSTDFYVFGNDPHSNRSGGTYVAYLFAHDAGGFGLTGTDNVISCGTFTTDGSGNATVNLGYEPQWLMVKASSAAQSWYIEDNMRAFNLTSRAILFPNLSNAEATGATAYLAPNSTGFAAVNGQLNASTDYIYIAIRRGPMKVPTLGTSVFAPVARAGTGATGSSTSFGQVTDLTVIKQRSSTQTWAWTDRLRGATQELTSAATTVETAFANDVTGFDTMTGFTFGTGASGQVNTSAATYSDLLFKRAPSFFDEVCYTGTGSNQTLPHNLGAVPQLMITKNRSNASNWRVYDAFNGPTKRGSLNDSQAWDVQSTMWNDTAPTSTVFTVGTSNSASSQTYVIYLFTTCAGVSKVGSYTGNGTTQTIDCGFTGGARFVLIKRTDSTGDWYVWDSARGIVAGNDPHLSLNTTAAEVTTDDSVDTDSTGFVVNELAATNINVTSATYIFLSVA